MSGHSEALLSTLVGFDTTSRLSNLGLIHFVRDYLRGHGVSSQLVASERGDKASLLATIGPSDRAGFLLAGHTDVVPVDGQVWSSDPFRLASRDERLVGRGCADMKAFIASALAAVPALVNAPLSKPVVLALTYDEEVGCLGVRPLLDVLHACDTKPTMGVVGEPTSMRMVLGHKGKRAYRVRVHGREGHSSDPAAGVNAVQYAARIITFIEWLNGEKQRKGPFDPGYDVAHTTLHVGTIRGGTSLNVIPAECVLDFEIRHIPSEAPEPLVARIEAFIRSTVEPAMRQVHADAAVECVETVAYPGLSIAPDADVSGFVRRLLDPGDGGPSHVAFGTEAGLYHERCQVPMVVCGPGAMSDAHCPDESIARTQVEACDAFMERLGAALCH